MSVSNGKTWAIAELLTLTPTVILLLNKFISYKGWETGDQEVVSSNPSARWTSSVLTRCEPATARTLPHAAV